MSGPLTIESREGVWTFTLNRPEKRNALSAELVDRLLDGVQEAHAGGARMLVFRGTGKNFSAGFDFSDVESQSEGDLVLRFVRIEMLLQAVCQSPCLTLGLAQGRNFGAGVDLLAACRHRVASSDATFRMPGLQFGLVLGTRRLGEIVGRSTAANLLEASATFNAARALEIGFVQRVDEQAAWDGIVGDHANRSALLDDWSRAALYDALVEDQADADLATLTRSAARAGLKERVARYLGTA